MPSVGVGITAFSAVSGARSAKKSRSLDAQRLALERERDAFNKGIVEEQNQYGREDRDYFKDRRDREESMLDPIQQGLADRANEGPDFEGAAARSDADVAQAYGMQRGQERRRRERYGINPASGVSAAESRRVGNAESLARVHGRNKSYLQEDDRDWARKIAAYGTGNMRNASPNLSLAQLGVSGASGVLGDMSKSEGDNASGAFGLAGKLFADSGGFSRGNSTQSSVAPFTGSMAGDVNYFDY